MDSEFTTPKKNRKRTRESSPSQNMSPSRDSPLEKRLPGTPCCVTPEPIYFTNQAPRHLIIKV